MVPDDFFSEEEFVDYAPSRGSVASEKGSRPPLQTGASEAATLVQQPLADRLRPLSFDRYVGQKHLVGPGAPLRQLIEADRVPSMIFWGPPGTGKTSLASLIARQSESDFIVLSAVTAGIADVRNVISHAKVNRQYARRTILFVDEIHRFNKAQQDAFLPHVESGLITLIGATTENPSFTVNGALLSRSRVFTLKALEKDDLFQLLVFGLEELNQRIKRFEEPPLLLAQECQETLVGVCDGDARRVLTLLEASATVALARFREEPHSPGGEIAIPREVVQRLAQQQLRYDASGEEHYNCISALHKTVRSSDPHGAAYWAGRMVASGEDPRYVIRRLIRMAGEDIGLADPRAVEHAIACQRAYETLGSPEGDLFLIQLAVYLAMAPKSNAIYCTTKSVFSAIEETGSLPVPLHLRNAPTALMKTEGYGVGYTYDHDAEGHFSAKQGLPEVLEDRQFYSPSQEGEELSCSQRLKSWDEARQQEREKRKRA